jgi:Tol biopolymer transport system component/predicted Ser/Thr protein kinase
MPLAAGDRLGPYEILAPIGAGGMGEVYKARDTRLDRLVAIKVSKEKFTDRFEREARAVAALNHPYICTLHDVGPDYLVMEYIEGQALKGPVPLADALRFAAQIAEALDDAHQKGITHRDLKPANIMATKTGVKLLDFGLARKSEADATVTMAVMGTPAYMSPEQWEGKPGDARSDIYALGCVVYELVTGKRVGHERAAAEPPALEGIIRTCLKNDPEDRWQSARDVKAALGLIGESAAASLENPWRERSGWIAAAVAVLGALVFLALWLGRAPVANSDVVSFSIYPPQGTSFSNPVNTTVNVPEFSLSPDGRTIVLAATAEGARPLLWRRPIGEVAAQPLPGTEDAQDPFWSPDNRWIGFTAEGKLKKIPAAGGAVQTITGLGTDFRGASWNQDDTIVFATGNQPIYRVASTGGSATPASVLSPEEGAHRFPQFLPDGRHFLYASVGVVEQSGVYAGSIDGKVKKLLVRTNTSAAYAPPGYLLFADGDTLLGQAFDAKGLELSGQPFLVAEHVGRSSASYTAVSASGTGAIAYAGTIAQNGRLTWYDRKGNPLETVGPEGYYTDFRLSPNEKALAASLVDPKAGIIDVWMMDLVRGSNTRFTTTRGGLLTASAMWSPDGSRVAFRTNRVIANEFYQRSASGGGDEQVLMSKEVLGSAQIRSANVVPSDWSPDGQNILFSVPGRDSGIDLWVLPLDGDRKPARFLASPSDELHGNFSPDGRFVAYTSNESGKFEIYVQTFPLTDLKKQVSTSGGYEPRWRADGREIYYLSEDRKLMAVSVGPGPSFGVPQPLFQTRVPAGVTANRTHYVPSRDGQRFLVNPQTGDPAPTPITVVLNWTAGLKK